MAMQRFTINLTQLRCIQESDAGPSEPYLLVTYFALGPELAPNELGPLAFNSPFVDNFRQEFKSMSAGDVVDVPPYAASASFDMDLDTLKPILLGCIVMLLEQNQTPAELLDYLASAYRQAIQDQLNALVRKRIVDNNVGPITQVEQDRIKNEVVNAITQAFTSRVSFLQLLGLALDDQDQPIGLTQVVMPYTHSSQPFPPPVLNFPEIILRNASGVVTYRFALSGTAKVSEIPFDRCARQRGAVEAKKRQIAGLQGRVAMR